MQTDYDTHLETLLEYDGKLFSNGNDTIKRLNDWKEWSHDTVESLTDIIKNMSVIEEKWLVKNQYIGGYVSAPNFVNDKSKRFSNIDNNLFPLIKTKQKIVKKLI